jgi:predicted metalloprotease
MSKLRVAALLSMVLGFLSLSLPAGQAQASTQSTRQELNDAAASIDAYWQSIFASYDFDYVAPELAFEQGEFDAPCRGEAEFAAYCGQDETIYLDARQIDLVSQQAGELLPAVLLAHEWGHHLTMLLLPYDGKGVDLDWVDKDWEIEVLADCFSGVYIGELWYDDELQEGDISDALAFMSEIGDPTHGTGDDRIVGFMHGFVEGFEGCDVLTSS